MLICFEGGSFDSLPGEVRWGTDEANLTNVVSGQGNKRRHEIQLTGLQPNTQYFYEVQYGNETSDTYKFWTAPAPGDPFVFFFSGDNRTGHNDHRRVVNAMLNNPYHEPRLYVNTGDLIETGGSSQDWATFFDIEQPLIGQAPILAAFGNHEVGGDAFWINFFEYGGSSQWNDKVYSYQYGNVMFITVDSNTFAGDSQQQVWLEDELFDASQNPEIDHIVMNLHHPVYSTSRWGSNVGLQNTAQPLFEQYGVDLVLTGHDHIYQRCFVNDITYLVAGGGGAPLYDYQPGPSWLIRTVKDYHYAYAEVNGPSMSIKVHLTDHTEIDQFDIGVQVPTPTPTIAAPTPTPQVATPTPVPAGSFGSEIRGTVTNGTDLKVEIRAYSDKTFQDDFTAYAAVDVGGAFYTVPTFQEGIFPIATFPLPAQTDLGFLTLLELPGLQAPGLTLTWYSLLVDSQGGVGDGIASDVTVLP